MYLLYNILFMYKVIIIKVPFWKCYKKSTTSQNDFKFGLNIFEEGRKDMGYEKKVQSVSLDGAVSSITEVDAAWRDILSRYTTALACVVHQTNFTVQWAWLLRVWWRKKLLSSHSCGATVSAKLIHQSKIVPHRMGKNGF